MLNTDFAKTTKIPQNSPAPYTLPGLRTVPTFDNPKTALKITSKILTGRTAGKEKNQIHITTQLQYITATLQGASLGFRIAPKTLFFIGPLNDEQL